MTPNYYNYINYESLVDELSRLKDQGLLESSVIPSTNILYGNIFNKTVSIILTLEDFKKFVKESTAVVSFNSLDLDNLKHGDYLSASVLVNKMIEDRWMYITDLKVFTYSINY